MIKIKKCIVYTLTAALLIPTQVHFVKAETGKDVQNKIENNKQEIDLEVPEQVVLEKNDLFVVKAAEKYALSDGSKAAELIESIKDKDKYKRAVSIILDKYYQKDDVKSEVAEFAKSIKESGKEVAVEYQNALEERTNDKLNYNATRLIVEFDSNVSDASIEEAMNTISDGGYLVFDQFGIDSNLPQEKKDQIQNALDGANKVAIVQVDEGHTTKKEMKEYTAIKGVSDVTRDIEVESDGYSYTNDPLVNDQWYIDGRLNFTWNTINSKRPFQSPVYVAVIDEGFDIDHPDLEGQFVKDKTCDVTNNYKSLFKENPTGDMRHGTHVAGIINAKTNNSIGVAGIASISESSSTRYFDKCKLMGLKVADEEGNMQSADIINAVGYALTNGADIISMSFGAYGDLGMNPVINAAHQAGVTLIASAGNKNTDNPHYPSDYKYVISVAAVDEDMTKAEYSNYGSGVDVAAPGTNICSTFPNGGYALSSGTSMAAPYVSGVVALMKQVDSTLTPDQIEVKLKEYATPLEDGAECGAGVVSLPATVLTCLP